MFLGGARGAMMKYVYTYFAILDFGDLIRIVAPNKNNFFPTYGSIDVFE